MYNIRYYSTEDYPMLKAWWEASDETPPTERMLPETTLIMEVNEIPTVAVSVYLTNSPEVCHLANIIGNPEMKGSTRKEACLALVNAAGNMAKAYGYNKMLSFAHKDKVANRFKELGMKPTMSGLSAFIKELV